MQREYLLSENATQKQVDDATEALTSAKNSLVYIKDLKLKVEEYEALDKDLFVEESYNKLQDVLVKGNEVLSNPVATKEQVTEIMAQLQDAFANLHSIR